MDFKVPALIRGTVAAPFVPQQRGYEGASCKVLHCNNVSQENKEHPVPGLLTGILNTILSTLWDQDILSCEGPGCLSDGF